MRKPFIRAAALLAGTLLALGITGLRHAHSSRSATPIADSSRPTSAADNPPSASPASASSSRAPVTAPSIPHSPARPHGLLGGGEPVRLDAIPSGTPLRESLERLTPAVLARALNALSQLTFNALDADSLRADFTGAIYASCPAPRLLPSSANTAADSAATSATASTPVMSAASLPIATPPLFHSRPGATKIIYLDFNGHVVTGTAWNTESGVSSYDCLAYDVDGDATTFNDDEQGRIAQIWQRVSEDYAPFDVDVTTEEPAVFNRYTARALITRTTDRNDVALPQSTRGGVSYVGDFGQSDFPSRSPAFVYYNNLGAGYAPYVAEVAAHEVGHNMGLTHDGTSTTPYYGGHGSGETSWGPIMGSPYGRNITQWSKGEYDDANNTQDDLAIIAGKLSYRADDAGDTTPAATASSIVGHTLTAGGVIESAGDADVFSFSIASAGAVSLAATPFVDASSNQSGNLDLQLALLSSSGTVLLTNSPADSPRASITTTLPAGAYFLRITPDATGAPLANPPSGYTLYGSLGQYTLTGSLPAGATFAGFVAQYFSITEQLDAAASGPNADPDGDGFSNLLEYAGARNPRQPDASSSPLSAAGISGAYLTLTYDRRLDAPDLTYSIQASDDLVGWTTPAAIEQVSVTPLSSTVERVTVRDTSALTTGARHFLRLKITTP